MRVLAKQIVECRAAHSGSTRHIGDCAKRAWIAQDPRRRLFKQAFVKFLASVKIIGTATKTGTQAAPPRFIRIVEKTDIFAFRASRRTRRKAINSGCDHAQEKLAIVG